MRHATLYRKWRPRRFGEVAGQEPVVRTLRRAIETDRVAHAYLFSGPRGTGKTSTAKVLAMGLNCVEGPTPEPCGKCDSCRAIVNNSSMDVVEMDAASNRGIDEIRELRDRVNLAPASGRVKVYIIDEVHMLTAEAFNALLKMLEEPPEHVIFVLATTEKHKVLPTIISRCQSFDFRRPGVPVLVEKLRDIADAESIEVEPEALTVIAGAGRGSFRDAEGLLDQLSSFADGPVTAAMVRELLGSVGSETLIETTAALHERRAADALRMVDGLSNSGKDLGQFVGELLSHLRNLMLLPHAPEVALAEVGAEERGPLEEQANSIPTAEVVRVIEALGGCLGRVKRGGEPKLELELTFLKLTRDYTEPSVETLMSRLEALEKAVANGNIALTPENSQTASTTSNPPEMPEPEAEVSEDDESEAEVEEEPGVEKKVEYSTDDLDWGSIIRELKARRQVPAAAVYEGATVKGFEDGVLRLSFPEELKIYVKLAGEAKRMEPLQEVLEERLGTRPRLEFGVSGKESVGSEGSVAEGAPPTTPARVERDAPPDPEAKVKSSAEPEPLRYRKPEASEGDGIIRDEQEAFIFVREQFGLNDSDGGS